MWLKQMGDAAQRYGITIQYVNFVTSPPLIFCDHACNLVCNKLPLYILSTNVSDVYRYSMAWTSHVMQSVAIPAVTQVRVSADYPVKRPMGNWRQRNLISFGRFSIFKGCMFSFDLCVGVIIDIAAFLVP